MLELDLTSDQFRDKILGCWIGKNCGGTLGTPVEKAWGEPDPFDIWWYPELREGGLPNDDLEMQLVWLTALEQVGPGLTARDLARYWLDHIGYNFDEYGLSKTNLRLGLEPPVSGHYNNWFIDCMGCPIRSEIWACIAPGNPRLAAQYAYQDAICDHAGGESVFGELFNVAVQSAGFVVSDRQRLIDIALSYVPEDSLTARAVLAARQAHADGLDWKEARQRVLAATPSPIAQFSPINLGFQVIGWLYGDDFGDAMCKTVNCGYDTDSSGGSIGSWLGIVAGKSGLPAKWIDPFGDAISTNESWGGVRHLTDGTTPIPTALPELADRIVAAAQRILYTHDKLTGGTTSIAEDELFADDSVRALWHRNPMLVSHSAPGIRTDIDYIDTPAVAPGSVKRLTTRLVNEHPDPISVRATVLVPPGWDAPAAQEIRIEAQRDVTLDWSLPIPGRSVLANSDRLSLQLEADGYPQQGAIPIVLIGANAVRVAGPYPAGAEEERAFDPEKATWREVAVFGNALPLAEVFTTSGVLYAQTFFHTDEAIDVTLGVDCSHPVTAWLDGVELFSEDRLRPIRPNYAGSKDGYQVVTLRSGWTELLVKIGRADGTGTPECHVVLSSGDNMKNGLPHIGRTRFPWD